MLRDLSTITFQDSSLDQSLITSESLDYALNDLDNRLATLEVSNSATLPELISITKQIIKLFGGCQDGSFGINFALSTNKLTTFYTYKVWNSQ